MTSIRSEISTRALRSISLAALTCLLATPMATEAAPLSVYGVGYRPVTGLPTELYRFNEDGPMEERWDIPDSRQGTTLATYGESLYVGEFGGDINRYSLDGVFLDRFSNVGPAAGPSIGIHKLETDGAGNVYVAVGGFESNPQTSFRLDADGNISQSFAHPSLVFPDGIDAAANGDVYIVNGANIGIGDRLFRFDAGGQYLGDFPIPETENPSDIAIDENTNELYIADFAGESIDVYDISTGIPIFRDTLPTPGWTSDVFVDPFSGRIFGTYQERVIDDTGPSFPFTGFEISLDGHLLASYEEDSVPRERSVRSIVAVVVPEPTNALLLVMAAVGLRLRRRHV